MTIEFKDGRYFAGLWYLEDEPRGNWMGAVYREPEGSWHLVYRHRYYVDDITDPLGESKDRKSWYRGALEPVPGEAPAAMEARLVASVDALLEIMRSAGYGSAPVHKLTPRTDHARTVMELMTREKWAHAAVIRPIGDA